MTPLRRLKAGISRIRLARLSCVLAVLAAVTTVPRADAAFSDSASLPTTTIATGQLQPPTAPATTQTCTAPPPVVFRGATTNTGSADESFAGPGSTPVRTTTTGFTSEWVTHTIALRPAPGIPSVTGQWTASTSDRATGYLLERVVNGTVQASGTVAPVTVTSATDGPLSNGVTYTYRISTYFQSWTSPPATAVLTTNC